MYKIGDTSGLQEKNTDDGKETVKIVGEIVDKMAKKCADVPKKMTAPNKIMEITDGCFSSAQVIEVKDEKSGGDSSSSEEAAAEEAANDAAKTSGSCGGGKSSKTADKTACSNSKSCCGGSSNQSTNQCTGSKLVDTYVPSTVQDMVSSGVQGVLTATTADQIQFQNSYCVYQPFPECATCPYGRKFRNAAERDLSSLFNQMRDAMAMLINGQYDTATGMFVCPGLAKSLMTADLGPIAAVAGANAVMSMVSLMSVRGALDAYADLASSALYTDFRVAVMGAVDTLFRAGSCVGIPGQFVAQVCDILTVIGCTSNRFTRMKTRSGSARSSRFGCGCNLWGKKGSSTKRVVNKAKSPATTAKVSRVTGKAVVEEIEDSTVDESIPTVYKSMERQEPSTQSVEKAETAKEEVATPLKEAKEVTENPAKAISEGKLKPTKTTEKYVTTSDTLSKPGKTYYKKDTTKTSSSSSTSSSASSSKYIKIEIADEKPLDVVAAKFGQIYEIEDTGITDPEPEYQTYKKSSDQKAVAGKTYYKKDPDTGKFVVVTIPEGTVITEEVYTLEVESGVSYQETTSETPVVGVEYFVEDANGVLVQLDTSSGTFPTGVTIYERMTVPVGSNVYSTSFTCSGPCVLNNGLMIEEPVFLDMASQDMGIDTTAFNTGGRTPAGEMVNMLGLGLSLYEVKMAYLIDHLRNGSILPVDVEGDEVSTILDTIADND